jgi:hypothetical protein
MVEQFSSTRKTAFVVSMMVHLEELRKTTRNFTQDGKY